MIRLEEIQERLRQSIKNSGKTQEEIADYLGITQSCVSKYLSRNVFPALDTLANLCVFLDESADYILLGKM